MTAPTLFPYQQRGASFLAERRAAILADDMGLGKTIQAVTAADKVQASLAGTATTIASGLGRWMKSGWCRATPERQAGSEPASV